MPFSIYSAFDFLVFRMVFFSKMTDRFFLHVKRPLFNPFLLKIPRVQIPMALASFSVDPWETFLIHLHNLLDNIDSAACLISLGLEGIGTL